MVPAVSDRISRVPPYSGYQYEYKTLRVQDCHFLWLSFPTHSTSFLYSIAWSYNPIIAETIMVWAVPISIATTLGITFVFFSSGYLDVSVHRVGLPRKEYIDFIDMGCPIRKFEAQCLFAAYLNLSQLITSFIASESLGIHRTPLFTSFNILLPLNIFYVSTCQRTFALTCLQIHPDSNWILMYHSTWYMLKKNGRDYLSHKSDSYVVSSRKEVFQPHLPVRLPCYDLAPVTSFTLGRSLRLRTSGTPGFHGLTGGVYKARERIHRAMADARLLANPTSWSRVADSNPNWDRL